MSLLKGGTEGDPLKPQCGARNNARFALGKINKHYFKFRMSPLSEPNRD